VLIQAPLQRIAIYADKNTADAELLKAGIERGSHSLPCAKRRY
jgi:hypothetical protein